LAVFQIPEKNLRAISPRAQLPPRPWLPAFSFAHSPLPSACLPPPWCAPKCPSAPSVEDVSARGRSPRRARAGGWTTISRMAPNGQNPGGQRTASKCRVSSTTCILAGPPGCGSPPSAARVTTCSLRGTPACHPRSPTNNPRFNTTATTRATSPRACARVAWC